MPIFERTTTLPPGAGSEDWAAYFREYRRLTDIKNGIVAEEEQEDEEPPFVVIESGHLIDYTELSTGAKSVVKRALAHNWQVLVQRSTTEVAEVLYKENSKEGSKENHNKGDVRYAPHVDQHFGIMMTLEHKGSIAAATHLIYTWREGKSAAFKMARTWDRITSEVEYYFKSREWDEDWFEIFCPKPERKTKPKATEDGIWLAK